MQVARGDGADEIPYFAFDWQVHLCNSPSAFREGLTLRTR